MFASPQQMGRPEVAPRDRRPREWCQRLFRSAGEVPGLLAGVVAGLEEFGYSKKDVFAVRLAVEEALVNAIKHGNRDDPAKTARLRYHVNPDLVVLEVEDEGAGFDPKSVPDPLAPGNLEQPCGRGLLLINRYMTWARHNARGNCITMCRRRTP
jgi:serine/threonine-protein kinase RsbW